MAKISKKEAIIAALLSRGEKELPLPACLSAWRLFTRTVVRMNGRLIDIKTAAKRRGIPHQVRGVLVHRTRSCAVLTVLLEPTIAISKGTKSSRLTNILAREGGWKPAKWSVKS